MTRLERLQEQEARALAKVAQQRSALTALRKDQRVEKKRAHEERHRLVGAMADTAGLFTLSDGDLALLLAALGHLLAVSSPDEVLATLKASG